MIDLIWNDTCRLEALRDGAVHELAAPQCLGRLSGQPGICHTYRSLIDKVKALKNFTGPSTATSSPGKIRTCGGAVSCGDWRGPACRISDMKGFSARRLQYMTTFAVPRSPLQLSKPLSNCRGATSQPYWTNFPARKNVIGTLPQP